MQFTQKAMQQVATDPANAEAIRESKELFEAVMQRATTDRAFRDQLTSSPKDALAVQYREMFGREIPAASLGADIVFVEPQADFTYVLPDAAGAENELSETELAAVAGGATPSLIVTYAAGVAVTLGITWAVDQLTADDKPCAE